MAKKSKVNNELRFQDLNENLEMEYDKKFKKNCKLEEKFIALTLMNQDRKMFMQNHNDRFRARLNKERKDFRSQSTGD